MQSCSLITSVVTGLLIWDSCWTQTEAILLLLSVLLDFSFPLVSTFLPLLFLRGLHRKLSGNHTCLLLSSSLPFPVLHALRSVLCRCLKMSPISSKSSYTARLWIGGIKKTHRDKTDVNGIPCAFISVLWELWVLYRMEYFLLSKIQKRKKGISPKNSSSS